MDPTLKLHLRANVVAQVMGKDMILLDSVRGHYFDLNATGALMLTRLLAGDSPSTVIGAVCAQFAAPTERVAQDLDALIKDLLEAGLIDVQT